MSYIYNTKGTCASKIEVTLEDDIIKSVNFTGGCNGNLSGISKIVEGMTVENVVSKFTGLTCGHKVTSCPDQLARAVQEAYNSNK